MTVCRATFRHPVQRCADRVLPSLEMESLPRHGARVQACDSRAALLMPPHAIPPQVTILFMDIKGFTIASQQVHPQDVMIFLNDLYARFDAEAEHCGVYKARLPLTACKLSIACCTENSSFYVRHPPSRGACGWFACAFRSQLVIPFFLF